MDEQKPNVFLERIAAALLDDVCRGELPIVVRQGLSRQAASALSPVISALGIEDPVGKLRAAFDVDESTTEGDQARQIAHSIRASLDIEWPAPGDDNVPATADQQGRSRTPPPEPDEASQKKLDAFFEKDADVFAELVAFEEEVGTRAADPPLVSRWQLEPTKARLMTMLRASRAVGAGSSDRDTVYPHRVRFEDALSLEVEFGGLDRRHALAVELADQTRRNRDLRSPGRAAGIDVHSALQDRFLIRHGHNHVVIQEWWVYTPGRRRRETITQRRERELTQPDPTKADYTFLVIEMARRRQRGRVTIESRWDNVDLVSSHLWEIKPLVRLQEGVLQESYYRTKYRFCALELLDGGRRVLVPWLEPGRRYPIRDRLTGELFIHTKLGEVAMPVSVPSEAPGVVPYVVFRRTKDIDMVKLISRVTAFIQEAYAFIRKVARIVRALIAIAIIIAFLIAVIVVWIVGSIAKPGQPGEELEPVPILVPKRKKEGVIVRGLMAVAPDGGSLLARFPHDEEAAETVVLGIGGLLVVGLPVALFGEFLSKVTDAIDSAMHHWARTKPGPEVSGPAVG